MNDFQPVFIVGSARSGTTMMGKLLSSSHLFAEYRAETLLMSVCRKRYGDIFSSQKKREVFLKDWFRSRQFRRSNLDDKEFLTVLDSSKNYSQLLINFLQKMAHKSGKKYIVDSTPSNASYFQEIIRQCSHAKFIWLVRDGRDVALSQEKLGWINTPPPFRDRAARLHYALLNWKLIHRGFAHKEFDNVLVVQYEEFLDNPHSGLQRIADFIDTDAQTFNVTMALDPKRSNSAFGRLGEASNQSPVGRWKSLDKTLLENFSYRCSDGLERFGYCSPRSFGTFSTRVRFVTFYSHIMLKRMLSKYYWFSKHTSEMLERED